VSKLAQSGWLGRALAYQRRPFEGQALDSNMDIIEDCRNDFGSLFRATTYGTPTKTVKITTPLATPSWGAPGKSIAGVFVDVYVTMRGSDYFVTDGGLLSQGLSHWGKPPNDMVEHFASCQGVSSAVQSDGQVYYYKTCDRKELVSACVHDIAHFVVHVMSALSFAKRGEKEPDTGEIEP